MKIRSRILIALALLTLAPSGSLAQVQVHQPLMPPVPLDPLDFPDRAVPVDLEGRFYALPDGNRVEWYRLLGWYPLSSRVALGGGVSYAGVEQDSEMRFGGGPAWIAMAIKLGPRGALGLAFDVDSTLPIGDESLYPVSSDAASIGLRVRLSTGRFLGGRGWVGWYTRRVSPPPQNDPELDRPDSDWPSGSGAMVAWHAHQAAWAAAFHARYDFAGLPEGFWLEGEASWYPVGDIGLRGGASVAIAPQENRPMDWGFLVGIRWRPGAPAEGGK